MVDIFGCIWENFDRWRWWEDSLGGRNDSSEPLGWGRVRPVVGALGGGREDCRLEHGSWSRMESKAREGEKRWEGRRGQTVVVEGSV